MPRSSKLIRFCHITNRSIIPWNRYIYITSCLFFVLKSKQLRISLHSFLTRIVYPFHKISSDSNGAVLSWHKSSLRPCELWALIQQTDQRSIYSYQCFINLHTLNVLVSGDFWHSMLIKRSSKCFHNLTFTSHAPFWNKWQNVPSSHKSWGR